MERDFVTVQQRHICFVIGLLVCTSTLRRPLPRICGTAEPLRQFDLKRHSCGRSGFSRDVWGVPLECFPPLSRSRAQERLPKRGFALFEAKPSLQSPGSSEEHRASRHRRDKRQGCPFFGSFLWASKEMNKQACIKQDRSLTSTEHPDPIFATPPTAGHALFPEPARPE